MKILHLTLKKKWFDMIASGEKKEEYREVKPYWLTRFKYHCNHEDMMHELNHNYTHVLFRNGYAKGCPQILMEIDDTLFSTGKKEWGAEAGIQYIVIKLGEILKDKR